VAFRGWFNGFDVALFLSDLLLPWCTGEMGASGAIRVRPRSSAANVQLTFWCLRTEIL
jgi:hypothetical protein